MAGQPPPGPLGTAAVEPRRESGALTQRRPKQAALGQFFTAEPARGTGLLESVLGTWLLHSDFLSKHKAFSCAGTLISLGVRLAFQM